MLALDGIPTLARCQQFTQTISLHSDPKPGLYDPASHRLFEADRGVAEISPLTPVNGGHAALAAGTYNSVNMARSLCGGDDLEDGAEVPSEQWSSSLPGETTATASARASAGSNQKPELTVATDQLATAPVSCRTLTRSDHPTPTVTTRHHPDVLLIHGEDDRTVPQCQSKTMHAALGRRAKLCVLPGIDHSAYFFTMMAGEHSRVLDCVLRFCGTAESRDPEP